MNGLFVLDASVTLSWCFDDEANLFTDAILERLEKTSALVPALWPFEVASALTVAQRRGRLSGIEREDFIERLHTLRVQVERREATWLLQQILSLTRRRAGLSAYDASYIELAVRENLPLATLDRNLAEAARWAGVRLVEA